jgi:hypothetical protein
LAWNPHTNTKTHKGAHTTGRNNGRMSDLIAKT